MASTCKGFARCAQNNGRAGVVRELILACKSVHLSSSSDDLSSDQLIPDVNVSENSFNEKAGLPRFF